MLQKQQQDGRDCLHNDLFVSIDINTKFHALQHSCPVESDIMIFYRDVVYSGQKICYFPGYSNMKSQPWVQLPDNYDKIAVIL